MTSVTERAPVVSVRVPSKINLGLVVGPRRPDGHHALSTVYHAVSIHDDVTVRSADEWSVHVIGDDIDGVPDDDSNLALRAAMALGELAGIEHPVEIVIHKEIPVAGGMAGGSADAAAALVGCDQLWGTGFARNDLYDVAADLGCDVPFLLQGGTAMGSGRGEVLTPVLGRGTYHWVLALSETGLSTAEVYAEWDRLRPTPPDGEPESSPGLMAALRSGDPTQLAPHLSNDLQEAALSLRPELDEVLDAGLQFGALAGLVSGSGPTVAFLAEGHKAAIDLAVALTASGAVVRVRRATGPVHGAHLRPVPRAV